ncbi:MAG: hypothetical protein CMP20_08155 [Rickettsiales bacterium]|nr:hypothetical protein [Rickettsiales bacterium]
MDVKVPTGLWCLYKCDASMSSNGVSSVLCQQHYALSFHCSAAMDKRIAHIKTSLPYILHSKHQ